MADDVHCKQSGANVATCCAELRLHSMSQVAFQAFSVLPACLSSQRSQQPCADALKCGDGMPGPEQAPEDSKHPCQRSNEQHCLAARQLFL